MKLKLISLFLEGNKKVVAKGLSAMDDLACRIGKLSTDKMNKSGEWDALIGKMDRATLYFALLFETNGQRREQILDYLSENRRYDADIKVLRNVGFSDNNQQVQVKARDVYANHVDKGMLDGEYTDLPQVADIILSLSRLSENKIDLFSVDEKAEFIARYKTLLNDLLSLNGGRGYMYVLLKLETNGEIRNVIIQHLGETSSKKTEIADCRVLTDVVLNDSNRLVHEFAAQVLIESGDRCVDSVINLLDSKTTRARMVFTMLTGKLLKSPDKVLPRLFTLLKEKYNADDLIHLHQIKGLITSFYLSGEGDKALEYAIRSISDYYDKNETSYGVVDELWSVVVRSINPDMADDKYIDIATRQVEPGIVLQILSGKNISNYVSKRLTEILENVTTPDNSRQLSDMVLNKKLSTTVRLSAAKLLYNMKQYSSVSKVILETIKKADAEIKPYLRSFQ